MRQVAARVKHPCFGVRVASVHKINRLHLENVACRGEKLLFEKTVFKTFCGEKDDKYMKTPHFRAVFSVLHLSSTHFGAGGVTRTHDLLITKCIQTLRLTVFRDFGAFPPRILRMSCPICSVVSTRSFPRVGHGVGQKRSLNPATSFTERRKRWISL